MEEKEDYISVHAETLLSYVLDENGYICDFTTGGTQSDETGHFYTTIPKDFYDLFNAYKIVDGELVLDANKISDVEKEHNLIELRVRRDIECFSIINRGQLWYNHLTDEQLEELDNWYNAWLEVTETKVIPTKPEWLN